MSAPLTYDMYDLYLSYVYEVLLFASAQQSNVTNVPTIYILL